MAQAETITDLGFTSMGYHMYLVRVTGLTLTEGAGTVNVPCDQIQGFVAQSTVTELASDYVLNNSFAASGNTITITVKKQKISDTNTWGAAATADVSDSVYDILVFGI